MNKKKGSGVNWIGIIVFLIVGINFLSLGIQYLNPRFGAAFTIIGLFVLGKVIGKLFSGKKKTEKPARKTAPNPAPRRRPEPAKPCPNAEPHVHAVTKPLTRTEQDESARRRRRENLRTLYDAGLLTREEYNDELERLKNLV